MNDPQCLGMCMIDPDSGVCLGCGRAPALEEISGVPIAPAPTDTEAPAPLSDNVQQQPGEGTQ